MLQQVRPLVVIPTYNEAGSLRALVAAVYDALPEASLPIVDDAPPNGTGRLADALAAQDPALAVLHRSGKQGLGTAYVAGLRYALERDMDCVVALDADFSHDPRYLPCSWPQPTKSIWSSARAMCPAVARLGGACRGGSLAARCAQYLHTISKLCSRHAKPLQSRW
jgi:glycosyltransferase involved in cell wall biosynthesis